MTPEAMDMTPLQVRVLGCLMEKELATPDSYPLTMHSLLAACNQTSNRSPVVDYDQATVSNAVENLRAAKLVRVVYSRSNRADKYRQVLDEAFRLEDRERAVLCVLLLRGPQTVAELRARTERLHPFTDHAEIEGTLRGLAQRPEPLVTSIERQPGQKEGRWAHLLGGETRMDEAAAPGDKRSTRADRVALLEATVEVLRHDLERLRAEHDALSERLRVLLD